MATTLTTGVGDRRPLKVGSELINPLVQLFATQQVRRPLKVGSGQEITLLGMSVAIGRRPLKVGSN